MATVRIHGTTDREKLKAATAKFMKKAMQAKRSKNDKFNRSDNNGRSN
jgi:hypothetical protein